MARRYCVLVLGHNKELWNEFSYAFRNRKGLLRACRGQ